MNYLWCLNKATFFSLGFQWCAFWGKQLGKHIGAVAPLVFLGFFFFNLKRVGMSPKLAISGYAYFYLIFYQELRQLFWGGTTFKQCVIVLGLLTNILNLPFAIMPEWKVQISNNLADFRWLVLAEGFLFIYLFFLSRLTLPQVPASCVYLWISIINHSLQADGICKTDKLMSAFKMDIHECGSARARQSQRDE